MNYKQRSEFRKTDKWHKFKAKCRLHTSRDFITKENLCRNWNLHHLDLNIQRYDQIDDMKRFMPLNPKTHEVIHEIFKWYKKDHRVLDRIAKTLELMEKYTNEVAQPKKESNVIAESKKKQDRICDSSKA